MRVLRVLPVAVRMIAIAVVGVAATAAVTAVLMQWLQPWAAALVATLVVAGIVGTVIWRALVPMRALFRALAGTVASYRDGDFSFGITWDKAPDPVMTPELPWEQTFDAGGFEIGGVLEPTVLYEDGRWRMWYVGFGRDGAGGSARQSRVAGPEPVAGSPCNLS